MKYKIGDFVKWERNGRRYDGSEIVAICDNGYVVKHNNGWIPDENAWVYNQNRHLLKELSEDEKYWVINDLDISGYSKNYLILKRVGNV